MLSGRRPRVTTAVIAALAIMSAGAALAALTSIQGVSPAGQLALRPQLAVARNGSAVFTWKEIDGGIHGRGRAPGGTLGPVFQLSDSGSRVESPTVVLDASTNAVFAWRAYAGGAWRIQARE